MLNILHVILVKCQPAQYSLTINLLSSRIKTTSLQQRISSEWSPQSFFSSQRRDEEMQALLEHSNSPT